MIFIDRISKARRLQIRQELSIIEAGGTIEYEDDDEGDDEEAARDGAAVA